MDTNATHVWWSLLCGVAVLNLLAWAGSALWLHRRHGRGDGWGPCRLQLLLSLGYVAGCAWRSAVPVFDVPRLALVDSWASSVLVGRSVATVAELCFAAQWALLLRHAARAGGSAFALEASRWIVPLIVLAEVCSWHAVLTTSNLGHAVEESLWAASAMLFAASMLWLRPRLEPAVRRVALLLAGAGLLYVAYMATVDVPMYLGRWFDDEAQGRAYLDLAQGLHDVATRWHVNDAWSHWKTEVVWMTAYFSVGVWFSIALAHGPRWRRAGAAAADPVRAGGR